jgi:hypothetical protein
MLATDRSVQNQSNRLSAFTFCASVSRRYVSSAHASRLVPAVPVDPARRRSAFRNIEQGTERSKSEAKQVWSGLVLSCAVLYCSLPMAQCRHHPLDELPSFSHNQIGARSRNNHTSHVAQAYFTACLGSRQAFCAYMPIKMNTDSQRRAEK